ncbi:MAG: hypothetical protein LBP37_07405 [Spirochaetaceae bacterium]|jgi:hypothetical protein|nr:hypothetical protein [Spirochaetaceae bacterium]
MKLVLRLFFVCLCAAAANLAAAENEPLSVNPNDPDDSAASGEEAIAARYAEWAANAFGEKRLPQAEAFLLRAADYASVSSDLSYLLALVKKELLAPARETLAAARLALATGRWTLYSREDALYIEAWALVRLGRYNDALNALSELDENERTAELRLLALCQLPGAANFETALGEALERYPHDPVFPRILFRRAAGRALPAARGRERELVDTALKRLPALLKVDGDLIIYAAPFMADRDEARRRLAAWRESGGAGREARIAALPICLETGVIGEDEAIDGLFAVSAVLPEFDRDTLLDVWKLLRTDEARDEFQRRLLAFSGVITVDGNGDGVVNARAEYRNGTLISYSLDNDQDGIDELLIVFESGWPVSAELAYTDGPASAGIYETGKIDKIFIVWGNYPALSEAARGKTRYFFRPMEFSYPAVSFETLGGPAGILMPEPDTGAEMFTDYLAIAHAYRIEQPGGDFPGGIERIECSGGVISSVKEYLNERLVAETRYEKGLPVYQRIDLDLDGRMETVRRFKRTGNSFSTPDGAAAPGGLPAESAIEVIESDWDGDGFDEYREYQ